MVSDISRRNVLGGAAAVGTIGWSSIIDAEDPRSPAPIFAQERRANKPMTPYIGTPTSRVDGRAKVIGAAKYAAEFNVPDLALAPAPLMPASLRPASPRAASCASTRARRCASAA